MKIKRYLTQDEINYITNEIKPTSFFPNISKQQIDNILTIICSELKSKQVYPEIIESLRDNITKYYYKSLVEAGENVGIVAAQSISERQTQLVLNTFHTSGAAVNATVSGVTRFSELLNASKKPKQVSIFIYVNSELNDLTLQEVRDIFRGKIINVKFKDIIKNININSSYKKWYNSFFILNSSMKPDNYNYCISFTFDLSKRLEHLITLPKVCKKLEESVSDIFCIYSPDVLNTIDIWIDVNNIEIYEESSNYITEDNKLTIFIYEVLLPNIYNINLCGIPNITFTQFVKKNNRWIVEALGSNLTKCFDLEYIDAYNTYSNNMWEILHTLGIEATREFLIQEFLNVISSDSYINVRHIELLVDSMLHTGNITSVSRYGMKTSSTGPLAKSSFETSVEQFLKAGLYSEKETTKGVSSSIMLGKRGHFGTGLCDLIYKTPL